MEIYNWAEDQDSVDADGVTDRLDDETNTSDQQVRFVGESRSSSEETLSQLDARSDEPAKLLFNDEQIQAIAYALRLAYNATVASNRSGVAIATNQIENLLAHESPDFDRGAFLELVYTTTVTRS